MGLVLFSLFSVIFLLSIEAIMGRANPYLGIFIYMIYPGLLMLGLFVPIGALGAMASRQRREVPPYRASISIPKTCAILSSSRCHRS
jgi:hypothetical protein